MSREMDMRFWLERADADPETQEASMEFDPRTVRLPFNDPDETEQARADTAAPSHDARIRHLQRVPLFTGFNEDELRRVAELSRIVEAPAGTVVTQIGEPGDAFFIIIDGAVAVRTPVGAGSELHPGDFFGEMSLLGSPGQRRSWQRPIFGCSSSIAPTSGDCWTRPRTSSGGFSRSCHVACDVSNRRYRRYSVARIQPDAAGATAIEDPAN